jgi:hypothetical protein
MQNTYHPQTAKFIATVCQNMPELSSDTMQGWIENPQDLQKVFRGVLCPSAAPSPKTFKTITLGLHKDHKSYRKALKAAGYCIGDYADDILKKISIAKTEIEVYLVVMTVIMTVRELGFKKGACRGAIYARALELGFQLCPAEVGPALRLAYPDQPKSEWLWIAMEPVTGSDGARRFFSVDISGGERWLHANWFDAEDVWDLDCRFVFVRLRKSA